MIAIAQIQTAPPALGLGTTFTGSINTAGQGYPPLLKLLAKDLLQRGDRVVSAFEGETCRQVQTRVETTAGGSEVIIEATYQTLPSGLTTGAQTEITVPARRLNITLNTMNYQPQ